MGLLRNELLEVLDINQDTIKLLIEKANRFYRMTRIPKRRGGYRIIYQPSPVIKMIQHFLKEKYFEKCNISLHATAYIKGKSIIDNVRPHIKNKHFLFIDIKDFFGSLDYINIRNCLMHQEVFLNFDEESINDVMKICTYKNKLTQGAVTSPILSNIYMFNLDQEFNRLVNQLPNGKYTRYSDDITVSSSELIDKSILIQIRSLFSMYNLHVNIEKTYFCSNMQKVQITGLRIINNNRLSLNTIKKKNIKNMIYHVLKSTESSLESKQQVLGHLNYLASIDKKYYNKLQKKYSESNISLVQRLKI